MVGINLKVGDRVRLVSKYEGCGAEIGDIGTIVEKDYTPVPYRVDFNGIKNWFRCERLELVLDRFGKDDIKPGYLVITADGCPYIVMEKNNEKPEKILVDKDHKFMRLSDYYNSLEFNPGGFLSISNKSYNIVKVYGLSKYAKETLEFTTDNRPLLWERKEAKPEPKKLTVAEIEKELGYSVEIISEGAENE